ncbi:NACHT, LRR and PYD domains-containing protein 1 homolog [Trachinotus anak]|uniref:NACHT, LRR and PYD domains-containing protein 1 homolog n=1 Tax=Trachinotus anak TaxID=443729 RepID=UPI0039F1830F
MQYMLGGPLVDITVISGKLDEVYMPHWICTDDNPAVLDKFAVLHKSASGDVVEQLRSHQLMSSHPSQFSLQEDSLLMRMGFPVKINCIMLIFKTNKEFLTPHVYLIPCDSALKEKIKEEELPCGYTMIPKPYPEKSLKMHGLFILTADLDSAVDPQTVTSLSHSETNLDQFGRAIGNGDYLGAADVRLVDELFRMRGNFVRKVGVVIISQLRDDLLDYRVLNDGEKEAILQENRTREDKACCLIDTVKNKGSKARWKMISHLKHRDQTLYGELSQSSELPV